MDINVTTVCEVDEKKLLERLKKEGVTDGLVRGKLEFAISSAIQGVLKKHIEDDIITVVLSTVEAYPSIQGSTECTVNHVSDTYLLRGNDELCKDLRSKIGSQAKVFAA